MRNRVLTWAAILAIWPGAAFVPLLFDRKDERSGATQRMATDLPPGVSDAWRNYIAWRLQTAVMSNGRFLLVDPWPQSATSMNASALVSLDMPWSVTCDSIGGIITFGSGESATQVAVYGAYLLDENEPELGVSRLSVAAARLFQDTCLDIGAYLHVNSHVVSADLAATAPRE